MKRFSSASLLILFFASVSLSAVGCSSTSASKSSSYEKSEKTSTSSRAPKRAPTSNSGFGGYRY